MMVTANWNPAPVMEELDAFIGERIQQAGKFATGFIRASIGAIQGSVVPFVASQPGQYPFDWDGALRESIQYEQGDSPLIAVIGSDAVDTHLDPGHHFSADEEFGHFWDGWAWDFQANRVVKVAPAHQVEPRPFLWGGNKGVNDPECQRGIISIISGDGGAV